MPIYEYLCPDGHRFEVVQRFSDDPVAVCEVCGKPVQRVLFAPAVHYKGKGFYATDYGRKGANGAKPDSESGSKEAAASSNGSGDSSSKSESKSSDSKSSDSKSSDSKSSGGEGSSTSKKSDSSSKSTSS
jgi:putative FmdB family regulatory protein